MARAGDIFISLPDSLTPMAETGAEKGLVCNLAHQVSDDNSPILDRDILLTRNRHQGYRDQDITFPGGGKRGRSDNQLHYCHGSDNTAIRYAGLHQIMSSISPNNRTSSYSGGVFHLGWEQDEGSYNHCRSDIPHAQNIRIVVETSMGCLI
jgi:hypothetical protein